MGLLLPKTKVLVDDEWRKVILPTHRCIITGRHGSEFDGIDPAHLGSLGRGIKRPDDEILPVLHSLHVSGHNGGEWSQWRDLMPDWLIREALRAYARQYYKEHRRP